MSKSINYYRRRITRYLTNTLIKTKKEIPVDLPEGFEFKTILISRPNHRLGNLLLITPILEEIAINYPNCKVDIFAKGGLANILFSEYKNINTIYELPRKPFKAIIKYLWIWIKLKSKSYDLVINVVQGSSSGRISVKIANAKYKLYNTTNESLKNSVSDYSHMAKNTVYNLRNLIDKYNIKTSSVPCLNIKLSLDEIQHGKALLDNYIQNKKEKTILLFTYATGAKCYSKDWWSDFYDSLTNEFKEHNIIEVLPVENISQINFRAPSFYSKDVREIAAFIAGADIFIGADSGIMHLASASLTTTLGLFSRTNPMIYQPYCNNSLAIDTRIKNHNDIVEIIKSKLGLVYDLA
jgi:ADP-heptose:LPS heptosyltransferase